MTATIPSEQMVDPTLTFCQLDNTAQEHVPANIQSLLAQYEDVFQEPKTLPLRGSMITRLSCYLVPSL